MIRGVGTDMVEIPRVDALLRRYGDAFLHKILSADEAAACRGRVRPAEYAAGRFAAKESVLKALGTGLFSGVSLCDIEIRSGASGEPCVVLSGPAARRAAELGIRRVHVSISHTAGNAVAVAVAVGDGR